MIRVRQTVLSAVDRGWDCQGVCYGVPDAPAGGPGGYGLLESEISSLSSGIRGAVKGGIADGVASLRQTYGAPLLAGGVAVIGLSVATLVLLWLQYVRAGRCCARGR